MANVDRYHHGDLRRSLIEASLALIVEKGADNWTLREVSRRVGVSHSASYRHFENKEQLLAAVSKQGFERLRTCCEQAIAKVRNPVARLRLAGETYVEFALDHPGEFQVMFSFAVDEQVEPITAGIAATTFDLLVNLVKDCTTRWHAKTGARIAWAHVHGLAQLAIQGQLKMSRSDFRVLTTKSVEALFHGLL